MRIMRRGPLLLTALIVCGLTTAAEAADSPNVMVIGEDAARDTVPRSSRLFGRVAGALRDGLGGAGFAVYDETAVTLEGFTQGRQRRGAAELIDIARAVEEPPLDVALIFTLYADKRDYSYTSKVTIRITGRLLAVQSGRELGSFAVRSERPLRVPTNCGRPCLMARVGDSAEALSAELGRRVTAHLAALAGPNDAVTGAAGHAKAGLPAGYELVFEGFSAAEVAEVEEYLVVFTGYRNHRPVALGLGRHVFWYETGSERARLSRNLNKMLRYLGMAAEVRFAGNRFTVDRAAQDAKRAEAWDAW